MNPLWPAKGELTAGTVAGLTAYVYGRSCGLAGLEAGGVSRPVFAIAGCGCRYCGTGAGYCCPGNGSMGGISMALSWATTDRSVDLSSGEYGGVDGRVVEA